MKKNGKNIKCKNCSEDFYISQSRFNVKKYCSRKCAEDDNYGFKPKEKNCSWCENTFVIENQLSLGNKYCSGHCKIEAFKEKQQERYVRLRKEKAIKTCKYCGENFEHTTHFKKNYCSVDCQYKFYSKSRTEKNNPNFRNGLYTHKNFQNRKNKRAYKHLRECGRYRKEFLQKYGYSFCEVCKINKNGTLKFEVHHIYFASLYPRHKNLHDNRNMIHICLECHHKFHAGKTYEKEFKKLQTKRKLIELFK